MREPGAAYESSKGAGGGHMFSWAHGVREVGMHAEVLAVQTSTQSLGDALIIIRD